MKMKKGMAVMMYVMILIILTVNGCSGKDLTGGESDLLRETESTDSGTTESKATTDMLAGNDMDYNTEEYNASEETGFLSTLMQPLSTFSADVDTASYSNIRRMLREGYLPQDIPKGAVKIEEILNYFSYDYETPQGDEPMGVTIDSVKCPWQEENGLIRIGLKTQEIDFSESPSSNLVLLLDTSGSMSDPDKLPLLKQSLSMLIENLGEKDRISIVTYAGTEQVVLEGARGNEKGAILEALECLQATGSTNGSAGIETAYAIAKKYFINEGNNRVILATDGDLNVGITSESDLKDLVEEKRDSGIYLSVLGFGTGNLKDNKMRALAKNGNGNYAYIDSLQEAKKVLVDEMGSTLVTVADDVKLQVEFNPALIQEYRLIGYEDRMLNAQDFTDDAKDAGEMGAGHSVTALYEVIWTEDIKEAEQQLKYQETVLTGEAKQEWATLKIRYKDPGKSTSKEMVRPFGEETFCEDIRESKMLLEATAAEFGMLLRDSDYKGNSSYEQIQELWSGMSFGGKEEIVEFLELVRLAGNENP